MKFLATVLLKKRMFNLSWMLLVFRLMQNIHKVCMKSAFQITMKFMTRWV